jgi:hypothetical protein
MEGYSAFQLRATEMRIYTKSERLSIPDFSCVYLLRYTQLKSGVYASRMALG